MLCGAACGISATTCPAATLCMNEAPDAAVTVTLTARDCGFETTTANGERCASRMQTFMLLHVKFVGQVLPGGSQRPATAVLAALPHACIVTFFTPGVPAQLIVPCTPTTSTALSRSAAQYSQPT